MADTFVKIPKILVGTQAQVESEITTNDIGFATDIRFYNATETDTLLASKQPVGDYATNEALSSGLATKQPVGDYATNSSLTSGLALKVAIAQGAENAGKILKIDDSGNVIVADESGGASLPILYHTWADHLLNDVSWLRADTFSWQSGDVYVAAYNHLDSDYESIEKNILYAWNWTMGGEIVYTKTSNPSVGDVLYNSNGDVLSYSIVEMNDGTIYINESSAGGRATRETSSDIDLTIKTDTIGDITITYYQAEDSHKICLPDQEENISALYEATGSADYYILDTTNTQFKLPRKQKRILIQSVKNDDGTWYNLYSDGWVEQGGVQQNVGSTAGYRDITLPIEMSGANYTINTTCYSSYTVGTGSSHAYVMEKGAVAYNQTSTGFQVFAQEQASGSYIHWQVSGYAAESSYASAGMRLEYYYVGNFEQSAIEQTAGITAETLNGKADTDLGNIPTNYDYVVESQRPTADNGYTWYRKYKSGWVEQGGKVGVLNNSRITVTLPVAMANNSYVAIATGQNASSASDLAVAVISPTTTQIILGANANYGNGATWQVSGMSAQ